jgi:hypothetical protein
MQDAPHFTCLKLSEDLHVNQVEQDEHLEQSLDSNASRPFGIKQKL